LRGLWVYALLVPALASAAPRAHKLRPEEDPKLGGGAKAFAKARVSFREPADRGEVGRGDVTVRLAITGYALVGGAHAHLIVDNQPALQIDDVSQPLVLRGVAPGAHVFRAVLCRPWHEVVKAPHAFALTRFWSGPRPEKHAAAVAEQHAWPNPKRPLLTYVLPIGEPARSAEPLELTTAAAIAAAEKSKPAPAPSRGPPPPSTENLDPIPESPTVLTTSVGPVKGSRPPPPVSTRKASAPTRSPKHKVPELDFYVSGGHLGKRSYKVRVVLDRAELLLGKTWEPRQLPKLRHGEHQITIDLLDRRGTTVVNPLNRTDRTFAVP
jgi:hypothetical protein